MINKFELDKNELPNIPVPHDCVITKVELVDEFLILHFEDEINVHDSIRYICPNADTLIMKIHLIDKKFDFYSAHYRLKKMRYIEEKNSKLISLPKSTKMEYLYHYVGYNTFIIELWSLRRYILKLICDKIDLEWIES